MDWDPAGPLSLAVHAAIADRRGRLLLLHRPETSEVQRRAVGAARRKDRPGRGDSRRPRARGREETGLEVEPGRLLGAGDQERREGRVVHLVLGASAPDREIVLSGEHDASRWVTPKGLGELPLSDWMEGWYGAQRE